MRLLFIYSVLAFAQPIVGWGDVGHRTVGYLAEKYFTDQAAQWVNTILQNDKGYDISDAAVWADTVRFHRPWSAPWHYIDAQDDPPATCGLTFQHDCGDKGCVVSAITNHTNILLDPNTDATGQSEALMYIVHFIGDIHQPLHDEGIARGGNEIAVCFDKRCTKENLHGIWDTDIIHKICGLKHTEKHNQEKEAAAKFAEKLHTTIRAEGIELTKECSNLQDPEKCSIQWAKEANAYVCSYVMQPGQDWLENNDLGGKYYDGAVKIVESQISKAGIRLAAWINALAGAASSGASVRVQDSSESFNVDL